MEYNFQHKLYLHNNSLQWNYSMIYLGYLYKYPVEYSPGQKVLNF